MASYDDRFLNRSEYTAPPQIIDNLTSDNPNAALSARQGKALKTDVQQLHATVSTLNTTSNQVVTKLDGASINKCSFVGSYGNVPRYFVVSADEYIYRFSTSYYHPSSNPSSNSVYPYYYSTITSTKDFNGHDVKAHKINRNITNYSVQHSGFLGTHGLHNSYVGRENGLSFIECAAYSPTLKKICFGGNGVLLGYIDATNGSVDINVSSLTQSFSNMDYPQFQAWFTNHQITYYSYMYHGCSICRIKWFPSINKFIALAGYGNPHGYNGAFLVLESSDGINWTAHSTPYLIHDFVYCESINKFIGIRAAYQTKIVNSYPDNMGGVQQNVNHNMNNFGLVISDDAINWNTVVIDYPSYVLGNTNGGITMTGIAWSNRLNKLIVTGSRMSLANNGMLSNYDQHRIPFILSTSNGTNFTFTQSLDYGADLPIYKVLWVDDANLFFGIIGNLVLVSADGINWYKYNTPPTDTYRAIPQYSSNGLYGVSSNDTVYDDILYHKHTKQLYFTATGNKVYDMLLKL